MKISIWQQFSSNNSSDFTVVGVFETPEAAQRAADEVRQMIETINAWWEQHPNEWDKYNWSDEAPTPPEVEIGERFGFIWPGAVEWYHSASIQVVLDRLVYITTEGLRPDTAGEPFDKVLTGLGGQGLLHGDFYGDKIGTILVDVTCETPDEEVARTIADEKLAYECMVRQEGRSLNFYSWPFSEIDLPGLILELKARGCTNIEYKLSASPNPYGRPTDPRDADLLIKLLPKTTSMFDRREIICSLWEIGDPRAVESLINALNDKDPDDWVAGTAANALADIAGERAVEPLIEALGKRGLGAAASALGKLGDVRAVEPLIAALQNNSLYQVAVRALGRIGEPARPALAKALVTTPIKFQGRVQEALDRVNETQEGGSILVAIRSEDATVRQQALEQIRATANLKALLAYLHNPTDHETVDACIGILVELEGERAIPTLIERARINDRKAFHELVKLDSVAVKPLISLAREKILDRFMRQSIVISITRMADPQALSFLIEVLYTERDPTVRENIIKGLGQIGDKRAVDALVKAFFTANRYGDIDYSAAEALEQLNSLESLLEPLIESLENIDSWSFPTRVDLLARTGDKRAVQPLVAVMAKVRPSLQETIRGALQKLGYLAG